ncbi:MAG: hypothetical protein RIF32_12165 [Leptospirales bacterium]|jgi:hypothetical protein
MKRLLQNWKLKTGSLAIAVFLFVYVQYSHNVSRTVNVRVAEIPLPDNLLLAARVPSFMEVTFYGSRDLIDLEPSEFRIVLKKSNPKTGENDYRAELTPELPENITATYQDRLNVYLDRADSRMLPVIPSLDLTLKGDLELGYVVTEPPAIRIRGPFQNLSTMDRLGTEAIRIQSSIARQESAAKTPVAGLPDLVEVPRGQADSVNVTVRLLTSNWRDRDDLTLIEDVPVRCFNDIRGLEMKVVGDETVDIYIAREPPGLARDQLRAFVFCPVYYDEAQAAVKPSFLIKGLPVFINDRLRRSNLDILSVSPALLDLQFEKATVRRPTEETQGFKEHVLP